MSDGRLRTEYGQGEQHVIDIWPGENWLINTGQWEGADKAKAKQISWFEMLSFESFDAKKNQSTYRDAYLTKHKPPMPVAANAPMEEIFLNKLARVRPAIIECKYSNDGKSFTMGSYRAVVDLVDLNADTNDATDLTKFGLFNADKLHNASPVLSSHNGAGPSSIKENSYIYQEEVYQRVAAPKTQAKQQLDRLYIPDYCLARDDGLLRITRSNSRTSYLPLGTSIKMQFAENTVNNWRTTRGMMSIVYDIPQNPDIQYSTKIVKYIDVDVMVRIMGRRPAVFFAKAKDIGLAPAIISSNKIERATNSTKAGINSKEFQYLDNNGKNCFKKIRSTEEKIPSNLYRVSSTQQTLNKIQIVKDDPKCLFPDAYSLLNAEYEIKLHKIHKHVVAQPTYSYLDEVNFRHPKIILAALPEGHAATTPNERLAFVKSFFTACKFGNKVQERGSSSPSTLEPSTTHKTSSAKKQLTTHPAPDSLNAQFKRLELLHLRQAGQIDSQASLINAQESQARMQAFQIEQLNAKLDSQSVMLLTVMSVVGIGVLVVCIKCIGRCVKRIGELCNSRRNNNELQNPDLEMQPLTANSTHTEQTRTDEIQPTTSLSASLARSEREGQRGAATSGSTAESEDTSSSRHMPLPSHAKHSKRS